MACYKHIDTSPRFLAADLTGFHTRFCNDATGAPAARASQLNTVCPWLILVNLLKLKLIASDMAEVNGTHAQSAALWAT